MVSSVRCSAYVVWKNCNIGNGTILNFVVFLDSWHPPASDFIYSDLQDQKPIVCLKMSTDDDIFRRVANPDPGHGAFLTPGSGIQDG